MAWKACLSLALVGGLLSSSQMKCPGGDDDDSTSTEPTPTATPILLDEDLGYACDVTFPALPPLPAVKRSFQALPTSNGYISATYAIDLQGVPVTFADGSSGSIDPHHRLISFTDHVEAAPTPTTRTKDFLYDLYLGLRVNGKGTWLGEADCEQPHPLLRLSTQWTSRLELLGESWKATRLAPT